MSPKNHIAWKFGSSLDTNYVMCRNVEICKLIKQISKEKHFVKENQISLGTFHNVLFFEHEIFKINKLFDTHVLKLPLNYVRWYLCLQNSQISYTL